MCPRRTGWMIPAAMDAVSEVAQAGVQILTVLAPRHPIDARGRLLAKAVVRVPKKWPLARCPTRSRAVSGRASSRANATTASGARGCSSQRTMRGRSVCTPGRLRQRPPIQWRTHKGTLEQRQRLRPAFRRRARDDARTWRPASREPIGLASGPARSLGRQSGVDGTRRRSGERYLAIPREICVATVEIEHSAET